jgi:hypothetical protein
VAHACDRNMTRSESGRPMTLGSTSKLAALVCVSILAACSSTLRIDGSSAATFERSVAQLQNDLPSRQRQRFDIALAVTWVRAAALDAADVDGDGDSDYFDARAMADNAGDLLAAIQRGDLVSTIEDSKGEAAAAAYFKQLDGLGYDGVVELAGALDTGQYAADLKRRISQTGCDGWKGGGYRQPLGNTGRIRRCE